MRERPILFNGEMVRAILDGRKTQTRRVLKLEKGMFVCSRHRRYTTACEMKDGVGPWWHPFGGHPGEPLPAERIAEACPYGKPGDRLWVRETWTPDSDDPDCRTAFYRATAKCPEVNWRWRPSIHMPRWASRIMLEITGVSVERMQDGGDREFWGEEKWAENPWVWVIEFKKVEAGNV